MVDYSFAFLLLVVRKNGFQFIGNLLYVYSYFALQNYKK